jgi:hypothetical protein
MPFFGSLDRFLHLNPIESFMAEEPRILHLPDGLEKIIGNLVDRDPTISDFATVSMGHHRFASPNHHQSRDRRIDESNREDLQDRQEKARNQQQNQKTDPIKRFARFTCHCSAS